MKDNLGDRMKGYESASQIYLTKRIPVIIRIDGKSFHTFTKKMDRPFDIRLIDCMMMTTASLVSGVEGCTYGYVQSDEISLLLTDYKDIKTEAWFMYRKSKIESVAASMATAYFNQYFQKTFTEEEWKNKLAFFDARSFSLPQHEVPNYFKWRQMDAERNSVQMLGRANFSHKQLHKKSCNQIQEMLFSEKGINWNNVESFKKRGIGCYKVEDKRDDGIIRKIVYCDKNIPVFDYKYFDQYIYFDSKE